MREMEHLKRNCKKAPTVEEAIEHGASKLRQEIQKATEIFDVWPPDEDSLLGYHTESSKILVGFITSIVHVNSKISERKKTLINSTCQDLMYSVSNGTIRTKKNAYLGLCLKRITGSKECLPWLNQSGHCISCDEVSKLFVFFTIPYSDKFWRGFNLAQCEKWIFGASLIWHRRSY